ncbi:hypothetical protein AOQ84DRAFT_117046 [Glonium stellatum]|uniref:Uncharacterized protein n=1 Tax=Glonium stellatum TaxID=574774 RepID=A0A8E2ET78_9PEZI|nr:hypothetical protein AOQ84DRAFT_117046 [Glonium stellatum]
MAAGSPRNYVHPDTIQFASSQAISSSNASLVESRFGGSGSGSYFRDVEKLSYHLPHLAAGHVLRQSCRYPEGGSVTRYDIFKDKSLPVTKVEYYPRTWSGPNVLHELSQIDIGSDLERRIVIVEDLSPTLIDVLGSIFQITPEFFEEHLNRSGYGRNSYNDGDTRAWNSGLLKKNYFSFKWQRPIYREACEPTSSNSRERLLGSHEPKMPPVEWLSEELIPNPPEKEPRFVTHRHRLLLNGNIFRQEWVLSIDPDVLVPPTGQNARGAWEERATLFRSNINGCDVVLLLLDPLPTISHSTHGEWPISTTEAEKSHQQASSAVQPLVETRTETLLPFTPVAPRGPERHHASPYQILKLRAELNVAKSTQEGLSKWIFQNRSGTFLDPMTSLLQLVHDDTLDLLHIMALVLEKIMVDSMDDHRIQERLSHWRAMVNRFQLELSDIRKNFDAFVQFVYGDKETPQFSSSLVSSVKNHIDALVAQIEKTQNSLRAELSILESKRGIAQAESVSKLTELAFFFIPLTFIATTYSMQIKELKKPPSISSFIWASITAVIVSYGLRLIVRSSIVLSFKRQCFRSVRKHGNLEPKDRIPAHVFLSWLIPHPKWFPLRYIFLGILITITGTVGLTFLWRRSHISVQLKETITVLFGTIVLLWVYLILRRFLRSKFGWHLDFP